MKKLSIAVAMAALPLFAHGEEDADAAYLGVTADAVSTAATLAVPGIVEANPLGWATVPLRVAAIEYAKTLPREERQQILDAVSAGGWGAAASNLLMAAGATAAAPVVGMVVVAVLWKSGEQEREFWRLCAVHRRMTPGVSCEYRRANVQLAMAPSSMQ